MPHAASHDPALHRSAASAMLVRCRTHLPSGCATSSSFSATSSTADSAAFDGFDPARDAVWMAEVAEESTHVWTAKPRIAIFLAAMRHFAPSLVDDGIVVHYRRLDDPGNRGSLAAELEAALQTHAPQRVRFVEPGEYRVREALLAVLKALGRAARRVRRLPLPAPAAPISSRHARGRRQLRMEYFYREMRQRHRILMEDDGKQPLGGQWNFDADNRGAFGRSGPGRRARAAAPSARRDHARGDRRW